MTPGIARLLLSVIVAMTWSATAMAAPDETPKSEHSVQEDHPRTGTLLRQDIAVSNIPVNKTYAQMTAEERAVIHSQYESIAPGDEPPFPANGLKPILQAIHQAQAAILVEGPLFVAVTVNARGKAIEARVYKTPDRELGNLVASVLLLTQYKPAKCSGRPCQMEFPLRTSFKVDR